MVQVPVAIKVAVDPLSVQTAAVSETYVTASPDEAVAASSVMQNDWKENFLGLRCG